MHTLILSICCSVAVSVLLKLGPRLRVDIAQAVAANYAMATVLCLALLRPDLASVFSPEVPWWILLALGVLLPGIFLTMAAAVRHAGIVLSDAAQRLSLLIPLFASFLIFGEVLSSQKLGGMGVALAALALLLYRTDRKTPDSRQQSLKAMGALLSVWVGYGVIDILFKQMARSGLGFASSLLATFVLAGIFMAGWLQFRHVRWQARSVRAGLLLGLLNFGNIYFYIRAHQRFPDNPTLVFSAMNIGVIAAGAMIGAGVFKERLNLLNVLGICLALLAIYLLIPR